MKRFLLGLLGFCCVATLAAGSGSTTPDGWYDDFTAAQVKAKELKRPILLLVTGSDWCPFCQKLKKEALDTKEFKAFAEKNLVLVYADVPRYAELPRELVKQNRKLASKFGVRGYPTTIILSPKGEELGRIGGFARAYVDRVKKIVGKQ